MIVLDTNVLSELMRPAGDPRVAAWLDRQLPESTWITTITLFELRFGLELLAPGKKRDALQVEFDRTIEDFQGRTLSFDPEAAQAAAKLASQRRAAGNSLGVADTEIAGIVASRRAALATRNVKHFAGMGFELMNPWD